MVKSNAERQAEYQRRLKQRLAQSVTPDDVLRAAQLEYGRWCEANPAEAKPWDDFAASFKGRRAGLWPRWVPESVDPRDYDDMAPEDAALCLKVAAVARAVRHPPAIDNPQGSG